MLSDSQIFICLPRYPGRINCDTSSDGSRNKVHPSGFEMLLKMQQHSWNTPFSSRLFKIDSYIPIVTECYSVSIRIRSTNPSFNLHKPRRHVKLFVDDYIYIYSQKLERIYSLNSRSNDQLSPVPLKKQQANSIINEMLDHYYVYIFSASKPIKKRVSSKLMEISLNNL